MAAPHRPDRDRPDGEERPITAPTGPNAEITQRGQEAGAIAIRFWCDTLQNHADAVTRSPSALPDAHHLVENVFDFADQVLAGSRAVATSAISGDSQAAAAAEDERHGPGSHAPLPRASEAPEGCAINGNNGARP